MNDFMTVETLSTFAGLVAAVSIIVQFTKPLIKKNFIDGAVRIYTFVISLLLTFTFAKTGQGVQGILLTVVNAILVSLTAMGGYEVIADPLGEKTKEEI
ncbi:hypothetical protein [Anaerosalibacter massiliensis]|uniref:hypothetical protein n=1 Tax=Anaerosalibacter massiliensis TaxID=1347392 RepID=UPI0005B2BAB8|nr:hypothetical protein [Anaerosalibacter massiliensis]